MGALLHHRHSGRLRPHRHTSYAGLGFLLLVATIILAALTFSAYGANPTDPVTHSVGVYAAVPGKVPHAPTITTPSSGQQISTLPVTIGGACESGFIVKVFANDILVGATTCAGGSYSVPVDLFYGLNTVRSQSFNTTGQGSPSSAAIGLTFTPPNGQGQFQNFNGSSPVANQLFIKADVFYKLASPGAVTTWPLELVGGSAPYAVDVSWGDGRTDVYSRAAAGKFEISHRYDSTSASDNYQVVVKAADAANDQAYLQMVAVSAVKAAAPPLAGGLAIAWPAVLAAVLVVISFFLGERYELGALLRRGRIKEAP